MTETDNAEFRRQVLAMDESQPSARKLARWVEAWIRKAGGNQRADQSLWMALAGPVGAGKSHAMKRAARFLRSHAIDLWISGHWTGPQVPSAVCSIWSDVVALERDAWQEWLYDLRAASWVLIDDMGSEVDRFKTGEPAERLRIVLDACENKWLLISTNVPEAQWPTAFDVRVADRLRKAVTLNLDGAESYRGRHRHNQNTQAETPCQT